MSGCLVITNYQLIFVPDPAASVSRSGLIFTQGFRNVGFNVQSTDGTNDEIRVPLCSIIGVDIVNVNSENAENSPNGQNAYQKLVGCALLVFDSQGY